MYRIAGVLLWFLALFASALAQTPQTFPSYVGGLTAGTTPFIGTEQLYMLQSGVSRRATLGNILGQIQSQNGTCTGINTNQLLVNTAVSGTGQLNVFDGTQCVPLISWNTSTHIPFTNAAPPGVVVVTQAPFNADNTGVNDATSAIQAAINSLPAGGGEVWFPQGTYKISGQITVGNGSSSAVSTRNGTVLVGMPNNTYNTNFTGYGTPTGPRLLYSGAGSQTMLLIAGPMMGWGVENLAIDCATATNTSGLFVVSGQYGFTKNLTVSNCTNDSLIENAYPPFGGVSNTNSFHNTYINTSINMPATSGALGVLLTSMSSTGTADSSFATFINTTITLGNGNVNAAAFYMQVVDTALFINSQVFGGPNTLGHCVSFDYTINNNFPSSVRFDGFSTDSNCHGGVLVNNNGSPSATAQTNTFTGIGEANGMVCPQAGTIANFTCNSTKALQLGSQSSAQPGLISLNGGTGSVFSTVTGGTAGGLNMTMWPGTGINLSGGSSGANILQIRDAGAGTVVANGVQVQGVATTGFPTYSAFGTDASVNLAYQTKGANTTHLFQNQAAGGNSVLQIGAVSNGTGNLVLGGTTSGTITLASNATAANLSIDGTAAPTCTFTSGGGTGPSCALSAGSNGTVGSMIATTGTAPSSTGTVTLTAPGSGWNSGSGVSCAVWIDNNTGLWGNGAVVFSGGLTGTSIAAGWSNLVSGVLTNLTASTGYRIGYHCFGK
jgi:Pectate lyase superfamily protein